MKSGRLITTIITLLFVVFTLLETPLLAQPTAEKKKSLDEILLASDAATKFKRKDYEGALEGFKELSKKYPQSPLLLRYIGVTLNALNLPKQAVEYFKKAIALSPRDAAVRYHLAESYRMMDDYENAETQLFYILDYPDKEGYFENLAVYRLNQMGKEIPSRKPLPIKETKPWTIFGGFAFEYDDNVSLSSNISTFELPGNTRAGRYKINSGLTYDLINNPKGKMAVSYQFRQNFHDNAMSRFNFRTHELSTLMYYNTQLLERPSRLSFRYIFAHGSLDNDTFSSSNGIFPSVTMQLIDNVVGRAYDYLYWTRFRNKGFDPAISSRTGFYNIAGGSLTLYATLLERKCFFTTAYELWTANTKGRNFDEADNVLRWVLHVPLIEKVVSDTIFEYRTMDYYKFSVEPKRYDKRFYFGLRVSRPLTENLTISGYYSYTDNRSDNDYIRGQFTYERHLGGVELSFVY